MEMHQKTQKIVFFSDSLKDVLSTKKCCLEFSKLSRGTPKSFLRFKTIPKVKVDWCVPVQAIKIPIKGHFCHKSWKWDFNGHSDGLNGYTPVKFYLQDVSIS